MGTLNVPLGQSNDILLKHVKNKVYKKNITKRLRNWQKLSFQLGMRSSDSSCQWSSSKNYPFNYGWEVLTAAFNEVAAKKFIETQLNSPFIFWRSGAVQEYFSKSCAWDDLVCWGSGCRVRRIIKEEISHLHKKKNGWHNNTF